MDITSLFVKKEPAIYYGNAEPEGKTVMIGGHEIVVGGWGAYEATRREAHWRANPRAPAAEPRSRYGDRTYISGQDAVESLLASYRIGGGSSKPLDRAAERLAIALEQFDATIAQNDDIIWFHLGDSSDAAVMTTITSDEIRAAVDADIARLHRIAEDIGTFVSGYARKKELAALLPPRLPETLPSLPVRTIPLRGKNTIEINTAVTDLERAAVPRVSVIENFRAAVASVFEAAAIILERIVKHEKK